MRIRKSVKHTLLPLLLVAVTGSLAIACSVPVFRYALEHWRPDAYVVYVFQQGDLTDGKLNEDQQQIIDTLQPFSGQTANVKVKIVDLEINKDPDLQAVWEANRSGTLPWIVVQSPAKWGPSQTIWQGEITVDNVSAIVESPTRRKIHERLVNGQSAVWVLLECGKKDEDDAAFKMLTTELKRMKDVVKLPEVEAEDLGDLSVDPNALKVDFSAVRISRDDPQEQMLVEMLLRVEPDLMEEQFSSQPMAFPVFGRGRALYALVGKGISADLIEEASTFLCGACQCTVKAQNPGVDLIMNVDWDEVIEPIEVLDEGLPPLAGFSGFGQSDDQDAANGEANTAKIATTAGPNDATANNGTASNATASNATANNGTADGAIADGEDGSLADPQEVAIADGGHDAVAKPTTGGSISVKGPRINLTLIIGIALGVMLVGVVVATMVILPKSE